MLEIELEREFYTPGQLAKALGMSRMSISRWIRAGKLKAAPINGQWRIHRGDIFAFLAQQRDAAGAST